MKKTLLEILLAIISVATFAQHPIHIIDTDNPLADKALTSNGNDTTTLNNDSILYYILDELEDINFRINGVDCIKLYPTENHYNFLKLNTRTGQIEQIQWSLNPREEAKFIINSKDLSNNTGCGTFELYPTHNMYQFILLDQVNDRLWHVQWGLTSEKRWLREIK